MDRLARRIRQKAPVGLAVFGSGPTARFQFFGGLALHCDCTSDLELATPPRGFGFTNHFPPAGVALWSSRLQLSLTSLFSPSCHSCPCTDTCPVLGNSEPALTFSLGRDNPCNGASRASHQLSTNYSRSDYFGPLSSVFSSFATPALCTSYCSGSTFDLLPHTLVQEDLSWRIHLVSDRTWYKGVSIQP